VIALVTDESSAQARRQRDGGGNPHAFRPRHRSQSSAPTEPTPKTTDPDGWNAARSVFILSVESLAGAAYYRQTLSHEEGSRTAEATVSGPSIGVFRGASSSDLALEQPRLAFDAVVQPGFTLGAAFGYSTYSASVDFETNVPAAPLPDVEGSSVSCLLVQPRIGYLVPASSKVAVWLRGGAFFLRLTSESDSGGDEMDETAFGLVLDPMLVISPIEHVGLLFGPQLDFGLTGSVQSKSGGQDRPELDFTRSSYGVSAGLALMF
jgi:hypothetical protein